MSDAEWTDVSAGQFIKWTTVGQVVEGTLIDSKIQPNRLAEGKRQYVYTILLASGEQVRFSKGNISERGDISPVMNQVAIGQKIKLTYDKEVPAKEKGMQPFKLIKVQKGIMNQEWLDAKSAQDIAVDFN